MTEEFAGLMGMLGDLTSRIEPRLRKKLAAAIATDLRTAQAKRIRANVEPPDNKPMEPRKPLRSESLREGAKAPGRQQRMFRRAAAPAHLRKSSSADEARVGFSGAVARIMRVHQYGLEDSVSRTADAPRVRYPARVVLGLEPADRERIMNQVIGALGGG